MSNLYFGTANEQTSGLFALTLGAAPGSTYLAQAASMTPIAIATALIGATGATTVSALATVIQTNLGIPLTDTAATNTIKSYLGNSVATAGQGLVNFLAAATAVASPSSPLNATYGTYANNLIGTLETGLAYSLVATNNSTNVATLQAAVANANDPVVATFTLTTGVDNVAGTAFNDVINGSDTTLTGLDVINGGAGNDTMNINDVTGGLNTTTLGLTVSNVETVNFRSTAGIIADTSAWTGTTALNVTQATSATLTAANTTAVTTSGVAGSVAIDGGSTQTVTAGTGSGAITLGGTTGATGAISVTDTAQAAYAIAVDGGTTVAVTASGVSTGTVAVGGTLTTKPSDAITVSSTGAAYTTTTANTTLGAITTTGGTTVSVTQVAASSTSAAAADTAATTITQSAITVNGKSTTTAVTVNQDAAAGVTSAVVAVAGVTESASTVFAALTAGQTLIAGGLTFTAGAAGTTAAQTAAAFANLSNGALQGNSTLGTYSGTFSGWSTGAATGTGSTTVVFTSSTANSYVSDLSFTGTGAGSGIPTGGSVTTTAGSAATAAVTGVMGVAQGVVHIADVNYSLGTTNTITTATVNGYGTASYVKSDALTSLNLSNSASTFNVFDNTATTLALGLNKVTGAVSLDAGTAKYTTLNVTTSGSDSAFALTAAAVTGLTVAGTKALDLSGSTLSALQTVTVSGSAGLTVNASGATVTDVNASATSGAVTATIDATKATYEGGSGVDTVTTSAAAPTKAISLGAGNDSLTLASGTTAVTGLITGGDGTDKLTMVAADAVTASGSAAFATKVTGFEVLGVTGATGSQSIDLAMLGNYNSVTSNASANTLTLNNMTSGGTLTITGASTGYTIANTAFTTPTTDVLNIVVSNASNIAAGTVTANKVETLNITSTDTNTTANGANNTLTVADNAVTAITVTGNAAMTLTATATTLTTVNAAAMTAGLTFTTAGTVAETVTGSATAANVLTAAAGTIANVLIGGSGADTLTANAGLGTLTGGAGKDKFVVATAGANVNTYTTITDAAAGDTIQLADLGTAEVFTTAKVVLGDTAVFQDYANAVVNAGGDSSSNAHIGWFQFAGNTYVVEAMHDATTTANFTNGTDLVVKLTGLVDLSTASLNTGSGPTLLLG